MKTIKTLGCFACAFLLLTIQADAKIWRVNNNSNYNGTTLWGDNYAGTSSYPVFKQITDAVASNLVSSTNGDTLYVEGSTITYTGVSITKKLIIIGPGYFLNENPKVSSDILSANLDNITFCHRLCRLANNRHVYKWLLWYYHQCK